MPVGNTWVTNQHDIDIGERLLLLFSTYWAGEGDR